MTTIIETDSTAFQAWTRAQDLAEQCRVEYLRAKGVDDSSMALLFTTAVVYAEAAHLAAEARERYEQLVSQALQEQSEEQGRQSQVWGV